MGRPIETEHRRSDLKDRYALPRPESSFEVQPDDFALCRNLHRRYGTTYYYATRLFPSSVRPAVHALYGFVRVADEWVDTPQGRTPDAIRASLRDWKQALQEGYLRGVSPGDPVLRAFLSVAVPGGVPLEEPLLFLEAMETDLNVSRYPTHDALRRYIRGSAGSVGLMMLRLLGGDPKDEPAALALGEAMQLTNFLRDVGEDALRGRIYLPQEDLAAFDVSESQILERRFSSSFGALIALQTDRARALYRQGEEGIFALPGPHRPAVRLAARLYARILDRLEAQGFDPFLRRARTTRLEKLGCLVRTLRERSN